jgi:hypothetical protein
MSTSIFSCETCKFCREKPARIAGMPQPWKAALTTENFMKNLLPAFSVNPTNASYWELEGIHEKHSNAMVGN